MPVCGSKWKGVGGCALADVHHETCKKALKVKYCLFDRPLATGAASANMSTEATTAIYSVLPPAAVPCRPNTRSATTTRGTFTILRNRSLHEGVRSDMGQTAYYIAPVRRQLASENWSTPGPRSPSIIPHDARDTQAGYMRLFAYTAVIRSTHGIRSHDAALMNLIETHLLIFS